VQAGLTKIRIILKNVKISWDGVSMKGWNPSDNNVCTGHDGGYSHDDSAFFDDSGNFLHEFLRILVVFQAKMTTGICKILLK